jgi:hypothetical protein
MQIRILLLIKVIGSIVSLQASPRRYFEPLKLLNFDFKADPDPSFHPNEDPDPASRIHADPQPGKILTNKGTLPIFCKMHLLSVPSESRSTFFRQMLHSDPNVINTNPPKKNLMIVIACRLDLEGTGRGRPHPRPSPALAEGGGRRGRGTSPASTAPTGGGTGGPRPPDTRPSPPASRPVQTSFFMYLKASAKTLSTERWEYRY